MPKIPNRWTVPARAVWMEGAFVYLIDQKLLPHQVSIVTCESYQETIQAIRDMTVRGAGSIGVAGGFATAQAVLQLSASESQASASEFQDSSSKSWKEISLAARQISCARPTAKNLSYAVERVLCEIKKNSSTKEAQRAAVSEAHAIDEEDGQLTQAIGKAGLPLLPKGKAVLTHCNAGWLAYGGWGTALAPIYLAHANASVQEQGRSIFVYTTETRPRSQGAKLTTWELSQAGIPHALIADTAVGYLMQKGEIGLVIVGADRIAANGDTANKIGTYTLSILAKEHRIPFYVAAPSPTFDPDCASGKEIPIEERAEEEVVEISGAKVGEVKGTLAKVRVATEGVLAKNPAFDVTPHRLITGFLTESGIIPPTSEAIADFLSKAHPAATHASR